MKGKARGAHRIGRLPVAAGLIFIAVAVIVVVATSLVAGSRRDSSLAGVGGPFTLVSAAGRPVSDRDFRGEWLLLYFGYVHCPDACPTTLNTIAEGLDHLGAKRGRIRALFISLDPERDTPGSLETYTTAFAAGIIGLTGTPAQIAAVAGAYRVAFAKHPLSADDYGIDHTSMIFLVDPAGKTRATFPDQIPPDRLARRLAAIVD